jgi:hypothetical protein
MGDLAYALTGALRLARLDRSGIAFFDRSLAGYWRSFQAAALGFFPFLLTLGLTVTDKQWENAGAVRVYLVSSIAYVIFWVGYPLLLLPLLRAFGREQRAFDFFVPYIWAQFLETALLLVIQTVIAAGALSKTAAGAALTTFDVACLLYEWFIAQVALDLPMAPAAALVGATFIFSIVIAIVRNGLL